MTLSQVHRIGRPPQDDEELWWLVSVMWGIEIPRIQVCPDHIAPFDAFADAFFARSPVSVWKASRGFGGKTTMMGTLTATEGAILGAQGTVLGGSSAQSLRVKEIMGEIMESDHAPVDLLSKEPTRYLTSFKNGGNVRALLASQRSVRGPHPQRLRLDEIDEMELTILEAAQGQPMSSPNVRAQTVMSSTHQYPDKTMSIILKRAKEKGWPVFEWCYRESMEPHGWLPLEELERKRQEVSQAMWDIEYDLQEPSFEGRAIDTAAVERAFSVELGHVKGEMGKYYEFKEPQDNGKYVHAADWARKTDWSIIGTYRVDGERWELVAWERLGRQPWPEMTARLDARIKRYGGLAIHDATGLGDVVSDLVEADVIDAILAGRRRESMFSDWVSAIESNKVVHPRIEWMYDEHRYVRLEDIYGRGHPPDSFVMGALAWALRSRYEIVAAAPQGFSRSVSPWHDS